MAVYMIQCGGERGPIKIGHSHSPEIRLVQIQISHWERLRLIRQFVGGEDEEAALHEKFSELHLRGEWHSWSPSMLGDVGLVEIIEQPEVPAPPVILVDKEPTPIQTATGQRLAFARKKAGLTQEDVARVAGVTKAAVCMWENSACRIRADRVSLIAAALNVTADWLFSPITLSSEAA